MVKNKINLSKTNFYKKAVEKSFSLSFFQT